MTTTTSIPTSPPVPDRLRRPLASPDPARVGAGGPLGSHGARRAAGRPR